MNFPSDMRTGGLSRAAIPQSQDTANTNAVTLAGKSLLSPQLQQAMNEFAQKISAKFQASSSAPQDTASCQRNLQTLQNNMSVDIYAVMAMAQKTAQQMRDANREIRASSLDAQVSELMSAADDMQKSADFKFIAGIVQGGTQIISGAIQMDFARSPSPGDSIETSTTKGKAGSDIAGGIGSMIAAKFNHLASSAEVSAKRHEATAKLHESATAEANDMMQQMMDVIRDVRDKLSAIDQSRIETNRGIARNI